MQLIFDQSLDVGFIPINSWQQRASLSFKPDVLERKVNNNDNITFFSAVTFAVALQPKQLSSEGCNTLSHEGLANVTTHKNVLSSY